MITKTTYYILPPNADWSDKSNWPNWNPLAPNNAGWKERAEKIIKEMGYKND